MKRITRREFLNNAVVGAFGTGVAFATLNSHELWAFPQRRSYDPGHFGLVLDGVMAGWLESVEGGHATSDVVNEKIGPSANRKIAGLKYEDITVNCGTGMSKAFYDWIRAAVGRQAMRKNGAILTCDYNLNEIARLEFDNALISEVGFPALDASSKDAARMTIKISPEVTRMKQHSGGRVTGMMEASRQKKWLPSNFRLQIVGVDCSRVNRIEAIVLSLNQSATRMRTYAQAPNPLVITLPESDAGGFIQWQRESMTKGRNVGGKARNGQLEYLSPDLREVLFAINFRNLAISSLGSPGRQAGSENIRRVQVEMYCEEIQFSYGSVWA